MAFPVSPVNGDTAVVNGINYTYSSATRSWARTVGALASNLNISGNLTTTGNITLGNVKSLQFPDADGSNFVGFKAPSVVSTNVTWTLPGSDGSSAQALLTDGLGVLYWGAGGGGGGGAGGYFNSTLTAFPGSTGNIDYGNGETYVGEAATVDAFGISIVSVFTCSDPLGSLQGPNDLGVLT